MSTRSGQWDTLRSKAGSGSAAGRTRSKWQEDFEKTIDQALASVESTRRAGSTQSRSSSIVSASAMSGVSPEAVPPPRSPAPTTKYSSPAPSTKYTRVPSPASSFAADAAVGGGRRDDAAGDIGSLASSLKSLTTYVQTMNVKLDDEREQRLRLEEKIQKLTRGNDECMSKLTKLEGALSRRVDEVEAALTTSNGESLDAWGALKDTVESYNDELEERVNQLAKTLVSANRDAKERSEAIERDFQAALEASAAHIDEQASKVDERFAAERKSVADKWDAVERNLTSRMEPLDNRLSETRATLTRMLEDANRTNDASRERQQKLISEQTARLRQQITDGNGLMADRMEKSMADMDELVKKSLDDVVQLVTRGNMSLKDEVAAVDHRCSSAMDEQQKDRQAAETRLKEEIKTARTELRELVKTTKNDLERADNAQTAELTASIQTAADDLAYDLETVNQLLQATEEGLHAKLIEEESARQSLEKDFTNKLGSSVHMLGNVIDSSKAELEQRLAALSQKVDVDLKEQVEKLDTQVNERLDDLKAQTEETISKSTADMTGKMDTMNVRIKQEMGPKLEKVETSAKDTERRLANLSTTVDLGAEDFKSFVNDVNAISEEVTAIGDKVDGMTAALDINALLMAAATQS